MDKRGLSPFFEKKSQTLHSHTVCSELQSCQGNYVWAFSTRNTMCWKKTCCETWCSPFKTLLCVGYTFNKLLSAGRVTLRSNEAGISTHSCKFFSLARHWISSSCSQKERGGGGEEEEEEEEIPQQYLLKRTRFLFKLILKPNIIWML